MRIEPVDYIYPRCSVYPHTLGDAEQSSWQHPHIPGHILLLEKSLAYLLLSFLIISNKCQNSRSKYKL